MSRTRGLAALAAAGAALAAASPPAAGYSFAVRARTMTQLYQLRGFRLLGDDVVYGRQRFTQSLALTIDDIGGMAARRRRLHISGGGPRVSFDSYLRLDQDFGTWTSGRVIAGAQVIDAVDLVPELDDSLLALDLLYGYVTIDGLADDRLTVRIGRQLGFDGIDMWALDGVTAIVRPPAPVTLEVQAGLRVRDASPLGPSRVELDGTTGADCQEYVEGPTPGSGHWRLIDRQTIVENRALASDRSLCPQRLVRMPTIGATLATRGAGPVSAALSYRRTQSATVGVIDTVDRLAYPDVGLYPDETGQAPSDGVNAEQLGATARVRIATRRIRITPYAWARASLVHHLIDRATLGAELRFAGQVVTPEVAYRVPTFDSDSLWSIFAALPTTDARVGWSGFGAQATAWLRRYHDADAAGTAYGVELGGERAVTARWSARLAALADGGYGGTRLGASAGARYASGRALTGAASLGAWRLHPDDEAAFWQGVAQGRATWVFGDRYALHGVLEASASRYTPGEVRFLGVLDLAFEPEL